MTTRMRTLLSVYRERGYVVAIVLLVALLAGVNWMLSPEQALRWLRGMLVLPALWFGPTVWYVWTRWPAHGSSADDDGAAERYFLSTLTMVVVIIGLLEIARFGLAIWIRVADRGDAELERRILGLLTGVVFLAVGNALPRILTPLSLLPVHLAERVTSARRFVGRAMVIGGVTLATAFVTLPLGTARVLTGWATLGVVLMVLGAIVWMNAGPARRAP